VQCSTYPFDRSVDRDADVSDVAAWFGSAEGVGVVVGRVALDCGRAVDETRSLEALVGHLVDARLP